VGRLSTEEVVLHLIKAKCLPVLLYGLEVCPVNVSDMRSLEFTLKRLMINLFRTYDSGVINSCMSFFGLSTVSELIDQRKVRFLSNVGLICRRIYCARFASRSNVVHCCWHVDAIMLRDLFFFLCLGVLFVFF